MKEIDRRDGTRGAVLVEFVLILPFLLVLLFGCIEFGLIFYNKQVLTNASREGARAGISRTGNIIQIVNDYCGIRLVSFAGTPVVKTSIVGENGPYAADLTVTTEYDYSFIVPNFLGFGAVMPLRAETVMKMERLIPP